MGEIAVLIGAFVLLPAALLFYVRPVARLVFFVLGAIFFFGIGFVMELGGPDSPLLVLPLLGLCLSLAALIAEGVKRVQNIRKGEAALDG